MRAFSKRQIAMRLVVGPFTVLILGVGCGQKPVPPSPDLIKQKIVFDEGLRALAKKKYAIAAQKFSDLLNQYPTSQWLASAYYNWGLSLEGLEKFDLAAEKYNRVVELYRGGPARDVADALYRLSICYEAIGNDSKMILTLLALQDQSGYLAKNIAEVELPARLAAAYSRQGNAEQGQIYFHRAEGGLKRLRRARLIGDTLIWLPKTFYSMGHLPELKKNPTHEEFKNYLSSLEQAQSWLLKAGELNDKVWAKKAVTELQTHYDEAWAAIDQLVSKTENGEQGDEMLALKERQDRQRSRAADVDSAISHLRLERLPPSPSEPEPQIVTALFGHVDELQRRLDILMQGPEVQDQDTIEAQKKEGLKREGRILDHHQ